MKFTATVALCTASVAMHGQAIRLDAAWWNHIDTYEQDGFILGFYDCHGSSQGPKNASTMAIRAFIDRRLVEDSNGSIPLLLRVARHSMHEPLPSPGGEHYEGKHGWLDGDWWGIGLDGHVDSQQGYVEGYIACRGENSSNAQVKRIIVAVNHGYQSVPVETAVADVMHRAVTNWNRQP